MDTVPTRIEAWLSVFHEERIPADTGHLGRLIGSDGRRLAREVGRAAGVEIDDERAERIDARAGDVYSTINTRPTVLPGAVALLDELDRAAVRWAVATSSRREQVGVSIAALNRQGVKVVDGSSVTHAKPHPELMLRAAEALGAPPSDCWCLGDSEWDMVAGNAAGMTPVGVLVGSAVDEATLSAANARLVVATLGDLIPLLGGSAATPRSSSSQHAS